MSSNELQKIKAERYASVLLSNNTLFQRLMRYYQDRRAQYGVFVVFLYVLRRILTKLWKRCEGQVLYWLAKQRCLFISNKTSSPKYAIYITGGLGDALIIARFVRDFQAALNHACSFDVYFHSSQSVASFFKNIHGYEQSFHDHFFSAAMKSYTFSLVCNNFVTLANQQVDRAALARTCPQIFKLFDHLKIVTKEIQNFIIYHPTLDGAFSDWAVERQHTRYNYLHSMMGLSYGGHTLPIDVNVTVLNRFGLKSKQFITIHDGWDAHYKLITRRPTKALPVNTWVNIVEKLKAAMPDLSIVQLGGTTGVDIPGVDVNLKNQLSFSDSTSVLAHSALHLDIESGLVHLGAALGTRSVVMFGPTNLAWFGYPENVNVPPKQCGNCWRVTDAWMDNCPLGQVNPVCMSSVNVEEVVANVLAALPHHETSKNFQKPLDV